MKVYIITQDGKLMLATLRQDIAEDMQKAMNWLEIHVLDLLGLDK